ncbi:hypothetical protein L2089_15975 [Paenibacillus hunanensis]|uniref:hypothetical protein n=1 Tax=Paenibacillus hunanensis TaxID=539262 RepID=UPI00202766EF|nr:hypothetical protein [Paenibacillus hunanensis]MCL9662193.1 hypothetical protein [Paenibacillus hunanensis]
MIQSNVIEHSAKEISEVSQERIMEARRKKREQIVLDAKVMGMEARRILKDLAKKSSQS